MRPYKKDLGIFLGLILLASFVWFLIFKHGPVEIQLQDTYFFFGHTTLTFLLISPPTFLIFFVRAILNRFQSIGPNVGLIIGVIFMAIITYLVIQMQENYLNEVEKYYTVEFLKELRWLKTRINLTWGLFGFWVTVFLLLAFQTIRLSKLRQRPL